MQPHVKRKVVIAGAMVLPVAIHWALFSAMRMFLPESYFNMRTTGALGVILASTLIWDLLLFLTGYTTVRLSVRSLWQVALIGFMLSVLRSLVALPDALKLIGFNSAIQRLGQSIPSLIFTGCFDSLIAVAGGWVALRLNKRRAG